MHRLEGLDVAVYDHLRRAAALYAVTIDHADQPLVGIGVDEYLHIHHVAQ